MHKTTLAILYSITCLIFITPSCKKEKKDDIDKQLYEMAKETNGFSWYKNSDTLLNKSSGTGHSQPFLRTRYNSTAATKLDTNGKVMSGISFPEGSLIVKELFDNSSTIGRYAILYKQSGNKNADSKGWVWGYVNADGSVASPSSNKGGSCINCHSQAGNIDYMLMNKFFP